MEKGEGWRVSDEGSWMRSDQDMIKTLFLNFKRKNLHKVSSLFGQISLHSNPSLGQYGNPLVNLLVGVRLPWLCCMGCRGYVAWVAVAMLHGLPWLCWMGCLGYVVWVAVVMLLYHMKVKSNPRFYLGGEFDKNKKLKENKKGFFNVKLQLPL